MKHQKSGLLNFGYTLHRWNGCRAICVDETNWKTKICK